MTSRLTTRRVSDILALVPGVEALPPEDHGQCIEAVLRVGGETVFAYFYGPRFGEREFARVVAVPQGCLEALTAPEGFYSFNPGDDAVFAASIGVKARALAALKASRVE